MTEDKKECKDLKRLCTNINQIRLTKEAVTHLGIQDGDIVIERLVPGGVLILKQSVGAPA